MTKQPAPYTAILPTILCQQPAVILHWLNEQRASGNLPVEIVLDVLIELVSRQTNTQLNHSKVVNRQFAQLLDAETSVKELTRERDRLTTQLEVYKRAVKATQVYIENQYGTLTAQADCDCFTCKLYHALAAVDKLEGVE